MSNINFLGILYRYDVKDGNDYKKLSKDKKDDLLITLWDSLYRERYAKALIGESPETPNMCIQNIEYEINAAIEENIKQEHYLICQMLLDLKNKTVERTEKIYNYAITKSKTK